MRIVIDTSTSVSALLWGGNPGKVFAAIRNKEATLVCSEDLLAELKTVLSRPKFEERLKWVGTTVDEILTLYRALIEIMIPAVKIGRVVPDDPRDDMVIACALAGNAVIVVANDHHLLDMGEYQGIVIMDAYQFLQHLEKFK